MDKISILKQLISLYQQLLAKVQQSTVTVNQPPVINPTSNAQKLVAEAKACLGESLWFGTGVDPSLACAISVNTVHEKAFGFPIGGGASTASLYQALLSSPYFKSTTVYAPGCIIISPTGTGSNPKYPNGHCGIVCNYGICANDSNTGKWSENYKDYGAWTQQFNDIEGYPTFLFQRI